LLTTSPLAMTELELSLAYKSREQGQYALKGKGINMHVSCHRYHKLVEAKFGICPKLQVVIKINPPWNYQAYLLTLDAVSVLLRYPAEALLAKDTGKLTVVLPRVAHEVVVNPNARSWSKEELSRIPDHLITRMAAIA